MAAILYRSVIATVRSVHQPLLGTVVTVAVDPKWYGSASRSQRLVVSEIERLTKVFDIFDERSELRRHLEGCPAGLELLEVKRLAAKWMDVTGGAFNPAVDEFRRLWLGAEATDRLPTADDLASAVAAVQSDAAMDNLNAIAKGWIVDRAVEKAMSGPRSPRSLVVEAGGDLVHVGIGSQVVSVEDPHRPFDNAPPIARVAISNRALATSGSARRFFDVGGRRFGHVIDPRTGWPVEEVSSATVIASDAATADVLATAVMVLGPEDGVALMTRIHGASCLIVDRDGRMHRSADWPREHVDDS